MPLFGTKGMREITLNKKQMAAAKKFVRQTYEAANPKFLGAWELSPEHPDYQFGHKIADFAYTEYPNEEWRTTIGTKYNGSRPGDWTVWAD